MTEAPDDAVFDAWVHLRASDPSIGLVGLYELAARARGVPAPDLEPGLRARLTELALPVLEPGFEVLPDSERAESDSIEVVPYDPAWPEQFARWHGRLRAVLGPAVRIEHVGSTAVPGLAAKPVIDIQVSVGDVNDEASYVPAIESIGIQLRSRDDRHRFFRPFSERPRDVQVHVCDAGGEWEARHLLFRDHLRRSPSARAEYLAAKQAAAARWRHDRIAYADAKSEVIARLLGQAGSVKGG